MALACVALVSCNNKGGLDLPDVPEGRTARVTISMDGYGRATKAAPVAANEVLINTVDAFVFNSTGDLDAYGHYTAADFVDGTGDYTGKKVTKEGSELECTTGAGKKIYLVINAPSTMNNTSGSAVPMANIATEAQLNAYVVNLEYNKRMSGDPAAESLDDFVMAGRTLDQTFAAGDNVVDVTVYRFVSRVWLKKITKNFSSAGLAGNLTVTGIYMSNVAGSVQMDGTARVAAADSWFNNYIYDANHDPKAYIAINAAQNIMLNNAAVAASPVVIAEDASATSAIESTFYVMPNTMAWDAPVGGTDAWSPRNTKLVVETEYAGTKYYYAIPVYTNSAYPIDGTDITADDPWLGLQANVSYEITELELTRLGSTNPDEPVLISNANFRITVAPWVVSALETESGKYVI